MHALQPFSARFWFLGVTNGLDGKRCKAIVESREIGSRHCGRRLADGRRTGDLKISFFEKLICERLGEPFWTYTDHWHGDCPQRELWRESGECSIVSNCCRRRRTARSTPNTRG